MSDISEDDETGIDKNEQPRSALDVIKEVQARIRAKEVPTVKADPEEQKDKGATIETSATAKELSARREHNWIGIAIVLFLLTVICLMFIWPTETFQRVVFPNKYWTKYWTSQIQELNSEITFDQVMIYDSVLELEKMDRTRDLDILQALNAARITGGLSREEAVREVYEGYQNTVAKLKDFQAKLKQHKSSLENAKKELSRYERGKQ